MAISYCHFQLLKELAERDALPTGTPLLEIGQAQFWGDFDPRKLLPDNVEVLDACKCDNYDAKLFRIGKEIYRHFANPSRVTSIDFDGPNSLKVDLNEVPAYLGQSFGLIVNHGTAEHIFNIGNVFKTVHNHCQIGGVMIHEVPWLGWVDHGFYCVQPTLFYDLATVNNYRIELAAAMNLQAKTNRRFESQLDAVRFGKAADGDYNLFVVLRKLYEQQFRTPMQGVYSNRISEELKQEWSKR